jgi:hypothetical protein
MDQNKRNLLSWGLRLAGLFSGAAVGTALSETNKSPDKKQPTATMRRIEEQETKQVELLYSTKPKRVVLGNREYRIPANHFGPKERDEPATYDASETGFGFFLFLPDYIGYTKENWRDPFDRRLIKVVNVRTVDKNAMVPRTDGTHQRINPEGYGEPRAGFRNHKALLEVEPAYEAYGLKGYRRKNARPDSSVTWVGTRSNGEFFFFESTLPPGMSPLPGRYALCQVRYYSEQEDLLIVYRYSQDNLEKWREIDDTIWKKLKAWRTK